MRAWFSIFLARLRGVPRVLDALASAALSDAPAACQAPRFGSHPPHDRPPHAGCGLRRLRALAVLPGQVPVLRLQQPRAPCAGGRSALHGRVPARDRACRRPHPRPRRHQRFPGRRHAVPDGPPNRRRAARRRRRRLDGRPGGRGHAGGQPDQRRGRALPRLPRRRRQPGLARRAGAERRRPAPARAHAHGGRGARRRARSRPRSSTVIRSTSSTPARTRRPTPGLPNSKRRSATRPSTSRSISSPSSPAPPSSGCTRQARWSSPTRTRRARSSTLTQTTLRRARPAGLRNLEPRPAGRRVPAQPRLLALRRIRRRRPRRAWPAGDGLGPRRHRDRAASRDLARPRRARRPRPRRGHPADPRRGGRRVPAHGPAPARGRRSRALPGADRSLPGREAHPGARSRWPHRAARTGRLAVTPAGFPVLDAVVADLAA